MVPYGLHIKKYKVEIRNHWIVVTNHFPLLFLTLATLIFNVFIYKLYSLILNCRIYTKISLQPTTPWSSFAHGDFCVCHLFTYISFHSSWRNKAKLFCSINPQLSFCVQGWRLSYPVLGKQHIYITKWLCMWNVVLSCSADRGRPQTVSNPVTICISKHNT